LCYCAWKLSRSKEAAIPPSVSVIDVFFTTLFNPKSPFGFVIFLVFHDRQRLNLLHQLFLFCLVCPVVGFGWIMFGTSLRIGSVGCGSPVLFQRIGALVLAVFAALIVGRILSAP
jgi:hypothetical protein